MAYYLQSLVRVIELILSHEKQHKYFDDNNTTPQLRSLLEKACSLRDAFANHAILSQQQDSFEDQIRDAAENAEDVLETYVSFFGTEHHIPTPHLQSLLQSLDFVKDEMMKILDGDHISADDHRAIPVVVASSRIDPNPENIVVGLTDDLLQLKDRVFGDSSKLEIIPIVGMGGIGKTTLARKLYNDSSVVSEFDVRAWATVSDDYSLRDILLGLLDYKSNEMIGVEGHKLGLELYQQFNGKRYMIVLDDIWRSNAWDDVKKYFPNENNRSRIILTTRQSHVATYVDSKSLHHQVCPLDKDDSWELLRSKVFGKETCLPELVEVGIKIANSCGGLPLAIQVIGGILSQTKRTKNSWEQVASNVISAIANEDEQVSSILTLSYNNLPYYIKPCFLYLSAFPEDFWIHASSLLQWWIAEGFLIPIVGKSPKEVAVENLNALIGRNLVFVRQRNSTGKVKYLGIHDLLRDLCLRKAHEKKFIHFVNGRTDHKASQDMSGWRRLSVLPPCSVEDIYNSTRKKQLTRSLLAFGYDTEDAPTVWSHHSSTLRLLIGFEIESLEAALEAVNLRCLSLCVREELDSRITTFWNLQFLMINGEQEMDGMIKVPQELFAMPHLKEIKATNYLRVCCDFTEESSARNLVRQENLYSLSTLEVTANVGVVLARFPNIKKLKLYCGNGSHSHQTADPISSLRRIEKLSMRGERDRLANYWLDWRFSNTLKSVSLAWLALPEAFMTTTLGTLPNLEYLSLVCITLDPPNIWKLCEGKFGKLKHLMLLHLECVSWEADETHFPILEQLKIDKCWALKELPSAIGEIPTLQKIQVINSTSAANDWALRIMEEQLDYGNDLLQVHID